MTDALDADGVKHAIHELRIFALAMAPDPYRHGNYQRYLDGLEATIAELTREQDRLRLLLGHIQCSYCGLSPATDVTWEWCYGEVYRDAHLLPGPDYCGPVEFIPREAKVRV